MKNPLKFLVLLMTIALMLPACEELEELDAKAEERLADYFLATEANAVYLYILIDEGLRSAELAAIDSTDVDGAWLKRSNLGPNNYVLDFGKGVTGDDGRVRVGRIDVSGNAPYLDAGSEHLLVFNNYTSDGMSFDGRMKITYDGNDKFSVSTENQNYNGEFTLSLNQSVSWLAGLDTPNDFSDDDLNISGTFSGKDIINVDSVYMEVVEPLNIAKGCQYGMLSGVVNADLGGENIKFESGSVDFIEEDGCLDLVKITFDDGSESATVTKSFKGF